MFDGPYGLELTPLCTTLWMQSYKSFSVFGEFERRDTEDLIRFRNLDIDGEVRPSHYLRIKLYVNRIYDPLYSLSDNILVELPKDYSSWVEQLKRNQENVAYFLKVERYYMD